MTEQQPAAQLRSLVESAQEAIASAASRPAFELPYDAPDRRPNPAVEPFDKVRGALLIAAGLLLLGTCLVFAFALQGRTQAALLDTGVAHSVLWIVASAALILSGLFSLRRSQLSARRQRNVTIYTIAAAALMACAITLASGFMVIGAAVVATTATLLSVYGVHQLNKNTARTRGERWATDAPLSFLAGLSMVYTLQLWFVGLGWNSREYALHVCLATVAISLVAAGFAHTERGRHALASGFGLCLIAAAFQVWRQDAAPLWVSAVWVFAALLVFLLAENRRFQINHAEHRAQRGKPVEF